MDIPYKTDIKSPSENIVFRRTMADPKGFEPLTFWSVARRSIQLS